jgi:hypothetical protein
MGDGVAGEIRSMAVYNGDLYVSVFSGLEGMQRWDGTQWHAVLGGYNNFSMTVFDGQLISGFLQPFAYDGKTWTPLPGYNPPSANVAPIYVYEVFNGDLILGGGNFESATGVAGASGLVRFDGTSWHALVGDNGAPTFVSGMGVHNGELITNATMQHPDGTFSHWSRWGSICAIGDLTGDGQVGPADLAQLLAHWGQCPAKGPCIGDIAPPGGDGAVGPADLAQLLAHWG